jgi:hypothetical protein
MGTVASEICLGLIFSHADLLRNVAKQKLSLFSCTPVAKCSFSNFPSVSKVDARPSINSLLRGDQPLS